MTGFGTHAPLYLAAGWEPFHLPHGKKVTPPSGYTGRDPLPITASTVAAWIKANPNGNVGLRLPDGVFALDVDHYKSKHGGDTLAQLEADLGPLPLTWCNTSRPDGVNGHRLFTIPDGVELPGGFGQGLDVLQGHHRYIVAPPSLHPDTGATYRWLSPDGELVPPDVVPAVDGLPALPEAWLRHFTGPTKPTNSGNLELVAPAVLSSPARPPVGDPHGTPCQAVQRALDLALHDVVHGSPRHDQARDHSLALVRLVQQGHAGAETALHLVGQQFTGAIRDRVDAREATNEWRSLLDGARQLVAKTPTSEADRGCCGDAAQQSGPVGAVLSPATAGAVAGEDGDLLGAVRNGAWLDDQTYAPLRYAVPELIPEGFALLAGPPKAGKSWMILDLCLAVASGGTALGGISIDEPGDVLYMALEDGERRMQDRMRQLLHGAPFPGRFDFVTRPAHNRTVETVEAWLAVHPHARLVVLDTLGRVMPPAIKGETTYERDYRVIARLKAIADVRPGLAFVAVHHVRKAVGVDFVDSVSGTNGIAGAADSILTLARARHSTEGVLAVTGRDVMESDYALEMHDGFWLLAGGTVIDARAAAVEARHATEIEALGDGMRQVVKAVDVAGAPVTVKAVATKVGADEKRTAVYLKRAADAGHIDRLERGLYVSNVHIEKVLKVLKVEEVATPAEPPINTPNTFTWPTDAALDDSTPERCPHGMRDGDKPD